MNRAGTGRIAHVGITVSDMDRSVHFYRDILGMDFQGMMIMEGPETDALFGMENVKAHVAYLNGSREIAAPPVELICFESPLCLKKNSSLINTSVSEICFETDSIDEMYLYLVSSGVECLSPPQRFDSSAYGFGVSRAFYFRDPDGIILEFIQPEDSEK